jgi:hypothetical protein
MKQTSYQQVLRAIGQGLEALRLEVFDLEVQGENYVIQGNPAKSKKTETIDPFAIRKAFLKVCKTVNSRFLIRTPTQNLSPCSELMLRFSEKDIDRLERDGFKLRSYTPHVPKPHSVPQTLRTLGWFIDNKEGRLLKIFMRGHGVRVFYSEPFGSERMEELSLSNVYDVWVHMYKQRSARFEIRATGG